MSASHRTLEPYPREPVPERSADPVPRPETALES